MQSRRLATLAAFALLAGCTSVVQGAGQASFAPTPTSSAPVFPNTSEPPSTVPPTLPSVPLSSPVVPSSTVAPPATNRFPRAPMSTAIGDPATADLCAAAAPALAPLGGLGYTATLSDRTVPPGCLIHMSRGGHLRFNVGVYGDRPGTQQRDPRRTTRKESGLTVFVYPFDKSLEGNCERDIAAHGVTLHVYSLATTTSGVGSAEDHCAATDALTHALAAAVAHKSVARLPLADPSLSAIDFCAALRETRIADLPGFAGAQEPDGVSDGCAVLKPNLDAYFEFQIETALIPQATSSHTVGGHHVYASDSNTSAFCTFYSVQGQTSGGRYERVSVSIDAFGKTHPPHLCASTGTALARFLDTLGLQ